MAASGIAEHHEARRREKIFLRKAFYMKEAQRAQNAQQYVEPTAGASTYDRQVYHQSRQGAVQGHDAASVDRQRRLDHWNQSQQEFSAKIPNRFNDRDYGSQW